MEQNALTVGEKYRGERLSIADTAAMMPSFTRAQTSSGWGGGGVGGEAEREAVAYVGLLHQGSAEKIECRRQPTLSAFAPALTSFSGYT